jgi:hypothetical protein
MNISKKIILLFFTAFVATQTSWSQNIGISSYTCTGAGSATLAVAPSTGITSYTWSKSGGGLTATTATITQPAGTYSVTIIKSGITSTLTSVVIPTNIVPAVPTVTPPTVATALCGAASQTLTSSAASNYSWNRNGVAIVPAVTTNTLSVDGNSAAAGTYSYTVTTTNTTTGCTATSSPGVSITISPKPAAPVISPATLATPICGTGTQALLATNIGSAVYVWKRAGTVITGSTNTITVTGNDVPTAGTYNYTVSSQNAAGCISDDSAPVALKISPKPASPTVTAQTGTTLLCGASTQTLSASGGGSSYTWQRGSTVLVPTTSSLTVTGTDATGAFLYTAALVNSVGCVSDFSTTGVTLTLAPAVAAPVISPATLTTPICGTATQALLATNIGSSVYVWKRAGTVITGSTNTITVTGNDVATAGTYNYTVSSQSAAGCISDDSAPVALKVSPKPASPTVTPQTTTTLLCGTSTQTLSASGGGSSYTWQRGSTVLVPTTSSLTVTGTDATGTFLYTAALINAVGCVSDFSTTGVTLTLAPAVATPTISPATLTTPICGTATQVLTTANVAGSTYFWKRDGVVIVGAGASVTNSATVTGNDVTSPGIYNYTVAIQSSTGCRSSDAIATALKVSPKPTAPSITPTSFTPNLVCGTDTKTLTVSSGGTKYYWKRNGTIADSSTVTTFSVAGSSVTTGGAYIFTVSLKNSIGCLSDDSQPGVILQLYPTIPATPVITPAGVVTFCEGGNVKLNSSYTLSTGFNIWSKTIGTTVIGDTTTTGTDGVTVRSVGTNTYTVKAKDVNGCVSLVSNPLIVTINALPAKPILNRLGAIEICDLDSTVLNPTNNYTGGTFSWKNGSSVIGTNRNLTLKTAGSYTLIYTEPVNQCASLVSSPTVLSINPLPAKPSISNSRSDEFCYGQFVTLIASSSTSPVTFEWNYPGQTLQASQIDVPLNGYTRKTFQDFIQVNVKSVSDKGCKSQFASDTKTLTVNPLPTTPTITGSRAFIFCPDSTITLTSSDSPIGVYKWINTKDNKEFSDKKSVLIDTTSKYFNISPTGEGKIGKFYVRTISDKNCLSDTSRNVTITVRDAPEPASILTNPSSGVICDGGKVTLKALVANINVKQYSWRDESNGKEVSTDPEISVSTSGSFSVKVRDSFGCFANYSTPRKITISPLPTKPSILIVKSKIFCDEDSTIVQSSLLSTTPNGTKNKYRWIVDGQTVIESFNRQFSWKKASSIAVAVTDSNGCKALAISDTIRTTVNPLPDSPTITARGAIPFCADKNVTLSVSGTSGVTFKWSTGATTTNITTNVAGNITAQSINNFGCLSKPSQPIQVRVYPLPTTPQLTANGVTTFCEGSQVRLNSSSPFQAYWWRSTTDSIGKGTDLTSIIVSKSGNYFAKVKDGNDCTSLPSTPLVVDSRPNPTPTIIKKVGTFTLDAQGVGDENGYFWRYNGDIQKDLTTRLIKATKNGDYQVQASITYTNVSLAGGRLVCYSKSSDILKYEQDLTFEGMSVFPNPSPNNEINVEVLEDLIGATITVYDFYGRLITSYVVDKYNTLKKISIPNYEGSTYIVKVSAAGYERTRKIATTQK